MWTSFPSLFTLHALASVCVHAQLVGPGAMAPYGSGGGGGRRHGGYVRVQDPAKGFFIAGSALRNMNGLYGKVDRVPLGIPHELQMAYKHDQTGWIMALTSGEASEWIILDDELRDRFRHEGKTIIPGSGQRWSHLHRAAPKFARDAHDQEGGSSSSTQQPPPPRNQETFDGALMNGGDDIAELPWQMIAILDESMLNKLRRYSAHHHSTVQRALGGANLPETGGRSTESAPPSTLKVRGSSEANDVCMNEEDVKTAISLYGAAMDQVKGGTSELLKWSRAILFVERAKCWRRVARNYVSALLDVEAALDLYPSYKEGLFEKGKILLDQGGHALSSLHTFKQLLKVDREFPRLDSWITRAVAQDRRTKEPAARMQLERRLQEHSNSECLGWRQTKDCSPQGEREQHLDQSCVDLIPSGVSGYCECNVPPAESTSGALEQGGSKAKQIFLELLDLVKTAGNSSCDRHQFSCTEECRLRWKTVMSDAIKYEQSLNDEGQKTLEYTYSFGRKHLEVWKHDEHRRFKAARDARSSTNGVPPAVTMTTPLYEAWRTHDLFGVLRIAHDFTPNELKRSYRKESVANHPDKGGSDEAFQRVAAAKATMSDPLKLDDYIRGKDLDDPNAEKQTLWEEVEKAYFPERFAFEPFGDPLEDHAEGKAAHERRTERIQAARQKRREEIQAGPSRTEGKTEL